MQDVVKRLMAADKAGQGPLTADEFLIAIHKLTPKGKEELKAQLLSMLLFQIKVNQEMCVINAVIRNRFISAVCIMINAHHKLNMQCTSCALPSTRQSSSPRDWPRHSRNFSKWIRCQRYL